MRGLPLTQTLSPTWRGEDLGHLDITPLLSPAWRGEDPSLSSPLRGED
jgi:hypothetical protein